MCGQGELGPLSNVLISDTILRNYISISKLSDIGNNVTFTTFGVIIVNDEASVFADVKVNHIGCP